MIDQYLLDQLSEYQIEINQCGNLEVTGYLNDEVRQKISANKPDIIRWVKERMYPKQIALEWLELIHETKPDNITHVVKVLTTHPKTLQFIKSRIMQLKNESIH